MGGYIDTDIDWVDLADDIRHEYYVVDHLRPLHGYKFRVLACNKFGWSIPSIPSAIAMTPSTGASKAEFYDALQVLQAREDINLDLDEPILDYQCEKQPLKVHNESPGAVDFISELSKGRFSVTANVSHAGKGDNLHSFSEQMVADIAGQILDGLAYIEWRGRVYLNLEPANILVCSGRSLGKTIQVKLTNLETCQTVAKGGTGIKGTYNFDYTAPEIIEEAQAFPQSDIWSFGVLLYVLLSGQLPFNGDSAEETKDNTLNVKFKFEYLYKEVTMEATRLIMWIFKRSPWKRPTLEEVQNHRWLTAADSMYKKRGRANFNSNRIQKFAQEYHRSRQQMDIDSASFLSHML